MSSWSEFADEAPELAARVVERFDAHKHKTMATLRRDGAPRISGTETTLRDGELWLAGMSGARRFADLRRDPRVAVHSGSDDPDTWRGDAKVAGRAVEVTDPAEVRRFRDSLDEGPPGEFELFRLDLTEVVVVRIGEPADHLVIESWHEGRGVTSVRR